VWLGSHKCRHGHTYLEHYHCYLTEQPDMKERIGFFDIETHGFDANGGIMLSYFFKIKDKDEFLYDVINIDDIKKYPQDQSDKRIIRSLIKDLKLFDRIVTHYGRKFDNPYTRTRALMLGIDFPCFGSIQNDDTWVIARKKLKLNNNRQETLERALFGKVHKTHFSFKYWLAAVRGDKKALAYILDHNKRDVIALEKIWYKLKDFVSKTNCSI